MRRGPNFTLRDRGVNARPDGTFWSTSTDSLAHLLGVEELPVGAQPDLVNHGWLEVHEDRPGHVLARPRLAEEGRVGVVS